MLQFKDVPYRRWIKQKRTVANNRRGISGARALTETRQYQKIMKIVERAIREGKAVEMVHRLNDDIAHSVYDTISVTIQD